VRGRDESSVAALLQVEGSSDFIHTLNGAPVTFSMRAMICLP
jgi:hypothetical protein